LGIGPHSSYLRCRRNVIDHGDDGDDAMMADDEEENEGVDAD